MARRHGTWRVTRLESSDFNVFIAFVGIKLGTTLGHDMSADLKGELVG
jgi:hypothetical protein